MQNFIFRFKIFFDNFHQIWNIKCFIDMLSESIFLVFYINLVILLYPTPHNKIGIRSEFDENSPKLQLKEYKVLELN